VESDQKPKPAMPMSTAHSAKSQSGDISGKVIFYPFVLPWKKPITLERRFTRCCSPIEEYGRTGTQLVQLPAPFSWLTQ